MGTGWGGVGPLGFEDAAELVVGYLERAYPMAGWGVSRVDGRVQVMLAARGVERGLATAWDATVCRQMVAGTVPPTTSDLPSAAGWAEATGAHAMGLRSYAGVAIKDVDGSLYGTICGFDPDPVSLDGAASLLVLLGGLLEAILRAERERAEAERREEAAVAAATTDALTGLRNRRGWDLALEAEGGRLSRLGDPAVVVAIDLDGLKGINDTYGHAAGDNHIRQAAAVLASSVRDQDVVARLGGDEFAWLLPGLGAAEGGRRVRALECALERGGVQASVGWTCVEPLGGLEEAVARADVAMYAAKGARQRAS